jgi:hypothetical protein
MSDLRRIAYFSMEIDLEEGMPTYSGGLGILAGDTIRSAADLSVPMVAITLLHRKGYFRQHLDPTGWQTEGPADWVVERFLEEMPQRADVTIEGRAVRPPGLAICGYRTQRLQSANLFSGYRSSGEHRLGSNIDPFSLWRRCPLSILPGSDPGDRGSQNVACTRVRKYRTLSYERRPRGVPYSEALG